MSITAMLIASIPVTNKSWVEIFEELAKSEPGRVIAYIVLLAAAAFLGHIFTRLYFTKVRYYKMENDLSAKQAELDDAKGQLQKLQKDYDELQSKYDELESLRDHMYVKNATKPDKPDAALNEFCNRP